MTQNLGVIKPGSTLYLGFDTFAGATGASITMTGLAVGDIKIYKNGGTTERSSTNGFTLLDTDGTDFDALTGIHGLSINLADNSDAGFYVAGGHYRVVISTVTVDTQTVSFTLAEFTIGYRDALIDTFIATLASQVSFTLTAGPAENDALIGCRVIIHDIASAVQVGQAIISGYVGASKTVTLAAATTFTVAAGDNISILPASIWNPAWDALVLAQVTAGLVAIHLDHLLAADYDPASKPGVATALLNEIIGNDAGVSQLTANALELAPVTDATDIANEVAALEVEAGYTLIDALKIIGAAAGGILSGAATATNILRSLDNSRNCIVATVDADGNRTAVTHNL